MNETTKPVQKRSIETRTKIMDAAFHMYSQKGYYQTTVDEIAKEAGVSTGIAYRYFKNKKDLLLQTLQYLEEKVSTLMADGISLPQDTLQISVLLDGLLVQFEEIHRTYHAFHEELEGLRHIDADVGQIYDAFEQKAIEKMQQAWQDKLRRTEGIKERLYLAFSILETYCHMVTDEKNTELDQAFLRRKTIETAADVICKADK